MPVAEQRFDLTDRMERAKDIVSFRQNLSPQNLMTALEYGKEQGVDGDFQYCDMFRMIDLEECQIYIDMMIDEENQVNEHALSITPTRINPGYPKPCVNVKEVSFDKFKFVVLIKEGFCTFIGYAAPFEGYGEVYIGYYVNGKPNCGVPRITKFICQGESCDWFMEHYQQNYYTVYCDGPPMWGYRLALRYWSSQSTDEETPKIRIDRYGYDFSLKIDFKHGSFEDTNFYIQIDKSGEFDARICGGHNGAWSVPPTRFDRSLLK